ncbi:MAG: hypothetical protein IJ356_01325 [Erysipelotrichaceae bacterium]|nr:hypothetical protein [Erysipelotrichaceae bacterium]
MNCEHFSVIVESLRKAQKMSVRSLLNGEMYSICNVRTYTKIRNCISIREPSIYSELMKIFHLEVYELDLHIDYSKLWNGLEYCDIQKILTECKVLLDLLKDHQKHYYYHFAYLAVSRIKEFYEKSFRANPVELKLLLEILPIYDIFLQKSILLFAATSSGVLPRDESSMLYKRIVKMNEPVLIIYVLDYYLNAKAYWDGNLLIRQIESSLDQNNVLRMLDFYDLASIYLKDQNAFDNIYEKKYLEYLQEHIDSLPDNKKVQHYGNLASEAILDQNYSLALQYLSYIQNIETRRKKAIYNYMIFCQDSLGMEVSEDLLKLPSSEYYSESDNAVYSYYLGKTNRTPKENKEYIKSIIDNDLYKTEQIYLKIMEIELYKFSKKTNRYKQYADLKYDNKI